MSERAHRLIGHFAGYQIQASEALRDACDPALTDRQRINILAEARDSAGEALRLSSNQYERALAYAQFQCAMGMTGLIELGVRTERVDSSTEVEKRSWGH